MSTNPFGRHCHFCDRIATHYLGTGGLRYSCDAHYPDLVLLTKAVS